MKFAAKDAEDFVKAIGAQQGVMYEPVSVKLLTDERATREGILDELDWLRREMTNYDVAMVFFSGHGVQGEDKRYRFTPMISTRPRSNARR